jgi:hypothetical protein
MCRAPERLADEGFGGRTTWSEKTRQLPEKIQVGHVFERPFSPQF